MIEQHTDAAVPAVMAALVNLDDPQALVDAHAAAVAAGRPPIAEQVARYAAHLGQELRATTARIDYDLGRCHESRYDDLHTEDDEASAKLRILEAVPAIAAAIDALPEDDVAAIWCQYGPYPGEDDE
ncbi:hypothetical protein [Methylobacterium planeticum]|uniref:Uncharacterized protein n=1 Tax=Methylobacterium planeticum TaxID=2615211 RepID=A0A6N6MMM2_9HYPH|nr:hypothetical protein [Methylobacterium planeticum]KAB1071154.1 hypothetical protein F6X51_19840 [Methylobacterium planeticum]